MKKPGQAALRRGRCSERGRIYHITTATYRRRPVFHHLYPARELIRTLHSCPDHFKTLAFVVMPDHLHWLLQLEHSSLSNAVQTVKSTSSHRISKRMAVKPPLWQKGFYDHAVRKEEDLLQIARYMVANPIRAGLVASPRLYSHWDAIWL